MKKIDKDIIKVIIVGVLIFCLPFFLRSCAFVSTEKYEIGKDFLSREGDNTNDE